MSRLRIAPAALLALFVFGASAAEEEATPLDSVTVHPREDAFGKSDQKLDEIRKTLPDFGEPPARKQSVIENLLDFTVVPSEPPPVSDAAKLSSEEHLRNSGRSKEQLP